MTRRHRTSSGIARPATAPSDPAGAFRRRLGLIFTQKIAGDLPDVDREVIETVVARTLALLAGSARHTGSGADPALYVMAHVLDDPVRPATRAATRFHLDGTTPD
ncbi:hypothetical protein [Frankia sp. AgKG'84/4]|uniref:hypothetical protein n=1 Tax=Frankia sp. AgKG'84/4 TaxID=573490 RepID=UPI00202A87AF|nr:hypothetical protein [Frankia sp. AgKG'84/4]MCL9795052.1 hypothetical protein [Frankia sp. AgKG'84/4]